MYILIHNSINSFSVQLPEDFKQINIAGFYTVKKENDYLYVSNREEFFLNVISESLDNALYNDVKAVIIDKNLGGSGWSRAISLAGHIACTNYLKCSLNKLPIILTDWADMGLEDPSFKDAVINNFFQTEGFYFRKYEAVFSMKKDNISGTVNYAIDKEVKTLDTCDIAKINIGNPYDKRHQTTNEWGAMRLASNFGFFNAISFTYPKHLYFKYLVRIIKNNDAAPNMSLHGLFNKILLIDDNANCGWKELLENIHKCSVDEIVSSKEVLAWQNEMPEKFRHYDLIYLDLYLDKEMADSRNALSTLRFLKGRFPHIPVIIFTASDKAWNLNEVLDIGADGMYIKESPLYFRDSEYSLKNYKNFAATIKYVHQKYNVLRPYWKAIQEIWSDNTFLHIQEKNNSKFRERIGERLEMFFGLLKRGLEQTEYNKSRFHFSDHELAFITLWSVLNEISEAYFVKSQPDICICDPSGAQITTHPGGKKMTYFINHYKWEIIGQTDVFVEYSYNFIFDRLGKFSTNSSGRFFKFTHEQLSYFQFSNDLFQIRRNEKTRINYEGVLYLQIAFLLERKNNLSGSNNKPNFQKALVRLNEIRNHLYLTHGSDISTGFYAQTENVKRSTHDIKPDKDIKVLFELIAFMLTGIEIKVNI